MTKYCYIHSSLAVPLVMLVVLSAGCSGEYPVGIEKANSVPAVALSKASPAAVPDVDGAWVWEEKIETKAPSEFIMAAFGILQSEGPVMHLTCNAGGTLTLTQTGASFTGTASQSAECETKGGQQATIIPFPSSFDIEGENKGRSVHFEALVGAGFFCPYQGSLTIAGGTATALNATGRCVVPFPVHPKASKSIYFRASRL